MASEVETPTGEPSSTKVPLLKFQSATHESCCAIPFSLSDYLELVDWTGRAQRDDKRGAITSHQPKIIQRLSLDPEIWKNAMRPQGNVFGRAIGQVARLRLHAATLDQFWVRGIGRARRLFG
jgi:hypothetical protein